MSARFIDTTAWGAATKRGRTKLVRRVNADETWWTQAANAAVENAALREDLRSKAVLFCITKRWLVSVTGA